MEASLLPLDWNDTNACLSASALALLSRLLPAIAVSIFRPTPSADGTCCFFVKNIGL